MTVKNTTLARDIAENTIVRTRDSRCATTLGRIGLNCGDRRSASEVASRANSV
jgi:hypothetical protein